MSNDHRLVFETTIPGYKIENHVINGVSCQSISLDSATQTVEPGKPQLPQINKMLGLPPGASIQVSVIEAEKHVISGYYALPSPSLIAGPGTPDSVFIVPGFEYRANAAVYNSSAPYPAKTVNAGQVFYLRDQRVAAIHIYPFQYYPRQKELHYFRRMKISVEFIKSGQKVAYNSGRLQKALPFDSILQTSLLNYSQAVNWRHSPIPVKLSTGLSKNDLSILETTRYKIPVSKDGIHVITKKQIDDAGFIMSGINPAYLRLFNRDKEIAMYVHGEDDGTLDENDYLEFYGRKCRNGYTYENVYWLVVDETTPGKRMAIYENMPRANATLINCSKTTLHVEQNRYYSTSMPNGEGQDHWFRDYIIAPGSLDLTVELKNLSSVIRDDCSLKIKYRGYSGTPVNPDHHTVASLNGSVFCDNRWDGKISYQAEAVIPQSILRNGVNTLNIQLPHDTGAPSDIIYLNWFELTYWQEHIAASDSQMLYIDQTGVYTIEVRNITTADVLIFDISDSLNPRKITSPSIVENGNTFSCSFTDTLYSPRTYLVITAGKRQTVEIKPDEPSQLLSTGQQADYLVITHDDFKPAIAPLVQHRREQGLSTQTIAVSDIYDEFNFGIKNPRAIKDFLKYAYDMWQTPAPTYVLLVGDASYDYLDYQGTGHRDDVPTHLFESSYYSTETASDNWFVCVSGDDNIPDMLIGRLPVISAAETGDLISKIIAYETTPVSGNWNKKILCFSDDNDEYNSFAALTDSLVANYLPDDFLLTHVNLNSYDDPATAKQDVLNTINQGCLIANYFGHGGIEFLAQERLLEKIDIAMLANGIKQPYFIMLSCLSGFFHHAKTPECLAETLLKDNINGAAGCFSPAGFAIPGVLLNMAQDMYTAAFKNNISGLGTLALQARLGVVHSGTPFFDHIDFYSLLGDPATQLRMGEQSTSVDMQIQVDYQVVGIDFVDGDPLMNSSIILINIDTPNTVIDGSYIHISLNERTLRSSEYTLTQNQGANAWDYQVVVPLQELKAGSYTMRVSVTNPLAPFQKTTAKFRFLLYQKLALDRVLNYPNPAAGRTTFTYFVITDTPADVTIKLYTVAGRLIGHFTGLPGNAGYNRFEWNGFDADQEELANGVYFYKVIASSGNHIAEKVERLVIMR